MLPAFFVEEECTFWSNFSVIYSIVSSSDITKVSKNIASLVFYKISESRHFILFLFYVAYIKSMIPVWDSRWVVKNLYLLEFWVFSWHHKVRYQTVISNCYTFSKSQSQFLQLPYYISHFLCSYMWSLPIL